MHNRSLKFASLFSGCGGFDLGFIDRGYTPSGAFDCDPDATQNFFTNIRAPIICTDLTGGIPNEQNLVGIDALIAGPPCQGFSTAGKRLFNDERNHLLTLTGLLARRILPKVLVVENVSGVLSGEHARYWEILDSTMRSAGYRTNTICIQAAQLGMAQLRRRVLFFAWRTRKDIQFSITHLPGSHLRTVLHGAHKLSNHCPKKLTPNSKEWLVAKRIRPGQKLSNVRGGQNSVATWDIPEVFGQVTDHERTVLELLRRLRRQERQRNYGDADPVSLTRLEAALGVRFHRLIDGLVTKGYLKRVGESVDLIGTFNGKYRRLSWDKPSCTVDTRFGSPRYFLHPSQQRGFTVREAARIQGFHDKYVFHGSEQSQFRLIGNAVPPPLAGVAADITKRLLGRAS